ncbi:MAG TPA: hypothetical protein VFT69_06010 [Pseudolabrys sp.]|nr:hypothetical protein [Pseudolabrys sp.]
MRAIYIVPVLLALGVAAAIPARAEFGDCNDARYLARFDSRLASDHDFVCHESEHIPVSTALGTAKIRIIQHVVADWATAPGVADAIRQGVDAAVRAMSRLDTFQLHDTTILVLDNFSPHDRHEQLGSIAAWASEAPSGECLVTVWLLGPGGAVDVAPGSIAHELFHCVQNASVSRSRIATGGGGTETGGNWWIEGSAEWFSTLALPPGPTIPSRVGAFDSRSPTTPLNRLSYDAYPFFAWLGEARGAEGVLPFLNRMATSRGDAAQHAAMATALPGDEWRQFAQDYLDRRIHDGQGASINSTPQDGEDWEWNASETKRIALQPFVLTRGFMTFHCGKWRIEENPLRYHATRPDPGSDWGRLPHEIDTMNAGGGIYRFAGMNTGNGPATISVNATQTASCRECGGTREIDRCLVGSWQLSAGGAAAWMNAHMPRGMNFNARYTGATPAMALMSDGTYLTGVVSGETDAAIRERRGTTRMHGNMTVRGGGRWSAKDGRLHLCQDSLSANGRMRITTPDGRTRTMPPVMPRGSGNQTMRYACAGSTFNTVLDFHRRNVPPMESTYTRTGPAPEPRR